MFATCSTLLLLFYCLQLTRSTVTNIKGKGYVLWLFPMVLLTEHTIKSSCFLTGMAPVMKQDRPKSELHGGVKAAGGPAAAFGASRQDHSQAGSGDTYGEVLHPLPCSGSGTSSSPWSETSPPAPPCLALPRPSRTDVGSNAGRCPCRHQGISSIEQPVPPAPKQCLAALI